MPPIHLRGFAGEIPRVQPRYLPDQNAQTARNVRLDRGHLEPIKSSALAHTAPGVRATFYKHGATWLTFTDVTTRVVPGPVATDRLYITSASAAPRLLHSGTEYPLALPQPTVAPVMSRVGVLDDELAEVALFAYTWVTAMGEESQPSPPGSIMLSPGNVAVLGSMPAPPTGRNITHKRIYRSQTTASGQTELFFIAEITGSDASYSHDMEASPLQEAITSTDFDPPPSTMQGIIAMPNGIMAAFDGRELLLSEPWQPHAWPYKYRLSMTDEIVALAAFGSSLAVLTKGQPYIVQGLHPEAMAQRKLEQPFPCVSARGVVDLGYSAVYPSTEGLVEITEGGGRLLTEGTWTREQWAALVPSSFVATAFNRSYVFSHTPDSGARQIGVLDVSTQPASLARIDIATTALWTDIATGKAYFLATGGTEIHELDPSGAATARTMLWRSKPFFSGTPQAMGAVFIEATTVGTGAGVRIIADGTVRATIPPAQFNRSVRLPSGRWRLWEVEVEGTSIITRISLGQVPHEVRL